MSQSPKGPEPSKRQERHFDSLEQEAFLNLWRTYDRLRVAEEELFGQHGLTPQQYNALRLLRGAHPERLRTLALAARLVSRAPDITRLLDRLVEMGLIDRARLPENRRVVEIGLTAEGFALLRKLDKPVRECHALQLGHLKPGDLKELVRLLQAAREPHEDPQGTWRDNLER